MKALLFLALISIQYAFCNPNARLLELHNSKLDTRTLPSLVREELKEGLIRRDADTTRRGYYIHLQNGAKPQQIAAIEAFIGEKLETYIPHNTYLVYITRELALGAQSLDHVLWVGEFAPEHKIPRNFEDETHKAINVLLVPYTGRTSAETFNIAKKWSRLTGQKTQVLGVDKIHVEIAKKKDIKKTISTIADQPESYYFESAPRYESHNYIAASVIQSNNNIINPYPMYDNNFNGTGQIIGLADTGLDYTTCFLGAGVVPSSTFNDAAPKIVRYISTYGDTQDDDGHGTAVGGTVAGYDSTHITSGNGINYNAKLHFTDIKKAGQPLAPPANLADLLQPAYGDGARIYVLPFGAASSWYNSDSVAIDKFTSSNEMLVVVSAGNTPGSKSLSGIALSKNALVVGASMSTNEGVSQAFSGSVAQNITASPGIYGTHVLCNFSSVGPTPDGRIKPDVVAPAQTLRTAQRGQTCGTTFVTGTSYAAGVAASAAAIAREYFTSLYFPSGYRNSQIKFFTDPPADLLKAIIINSGQSLSLVGAANGQYAQISGIPDPRQGYGRIQLDQTLYLTSPQSSRNLLITPIQRDPLSTGNTRIYCVTTTKASATFKATLVWMDRDASPVAGHLLVNDLDLFVMDPNGVVFKPTSGNGYWDSSNNVEQIELSNIPMGAGYSIGVHARNIQVGTQNWTLVMSGDIAQDSFCSQTAGVCPGSCSGFGQCDLDQGACVCASGRSGVDCSIDSNACPITSGKVCAGNGDCDYGTGLCMCQNGYEEPTCASLKAVSTSGSTSEPVVFTPAKGGYSSGLLAGCIVAAFFVGAIISVFLGGFLAVKYLEYRRDKAARERSEEMQT